MESKIRLKKIKDLMGIEVPLRLRNTKYNLDNINISNAEEKNEETKEEFINKNKFIIDVIRNFGGNIPKNEDILELEDRRFNQLKESVLIFANKNKKN